MYDLFILVILFGEIVIRVAHELNVIHDKLTHNSFLKLIITHSLVGYSLHHTTVINCYSVLN